MYALQKQIGVLMKTLGLIGGIGPESTIDYYKMLIKKYREIKGENEYPSFLINNINMTEMLDYIKNKKNEELVKYLSNEINKIEKAGADFAALASNTPHLVFDELQKNVNIPLISIVEETVKFCAKRGFVNTGLFGTMFTMEAGFYQQIGEKYSVKVKIPEENERKFIHEIYFNELVPGIIKESTRKKLVEIACNLKDKCGISGLILGGTELPLILKQEEFKDIVILNTSEIHINAIIKKMINNEDF
ncbi:MAG: amino acid racemase [Ignavibacteria bacterium]|nr:amino acid racemase [Ignavibacteria bacterium]